MGLWEPTRTDIWCCLVLRKEMSLRCGCMESIHLKEAPLHTAVERFLRYVVNEKNQSAEQCKIGYLLCKNEGER